VLVRVVSREEMLAVVLLYFFLWVTRFMGYVALDIPFNLFYPLPLRCVGIISAVLYKKHSAYKTSPEDGIFRFESY